MCYNRNINEYAEILAQRTSAKFSESALGVITNNPSTIFVTAYYHFNLIVADPDDNKFVDCAVASNAKYVVTEDSHFNILKEIDFPKVEIVDLDDIIKQIQ